MATKKVTAEFGGRDCKAENPKTVVRRIEGIRTLRLDPHD
jgi:hypothetical protein